MLLFIFFIIYYNINIIADKHIRQSTLDKLWNKQFGAIQMLLTILEVNITSSIQIISKTHNIAYDVIKLLLFIAELKRHGNVDLYHINIAGSVVFKTGEG